MSRRVYLERATAEDVPALAALEAACFSHPWTQAQIAAELGVGPPGAVLVLRGLGDSHGRGDTGRELCAACAYRVVVDEMEILDVAVHPAWRRQGLAGVLLRCALRRGARAGARTAFLEVRAGNRAGLRLYESLGFARAGLRPGYYREPVEDAVLLCRSGLEQVS